MMSSFSDPSARTAIGMQHCLMRFKVAYLAGYSQVFLQQQQRALHLSRQATGYTPHNKPNTTNLLDWLLPGVSVPAAATSPPSVLWRNTPPVERPITHQKTNKTTEAYLVASCADPAELHHTGRVQCLHRPVQLRVPPSGRL
jgi:hypothetical protein